MENFEKTMEKLQKVMNKNKVTLEGTLIMDGNESKFTDKINSVRNNGETYTFLCEKNIFSVPNGYGYEFTELNAVYNNENYKLI